MSDILSAPSAEDVLVIDRLDIECLVPRGHPQPDRLVHRMETIARERLAAACADVTLAGLDERDPSVWLIRDLKIDVPLATRGGDDAGVTRHFGEALLGAVARTVAGGADGDHILVFADLESYLAQFVFDLARGDAWNKWYYDVFDSLRILPAPIAAREALTGRPDLAEGALLRLTATVRLEAVLRAWSDEDARRVMDACVPRQDADEGEAAMSRRAVDAVVAAWPAVPFSSHGAATASNLLRVYLAVRGRDCAVPPQSVRAALECLLPLADLLGSRVRPESAAPARTGDAGRERADAADLDEARAMLLRVSDRDEAWTRHVTETVGARPGTRQRAGDATLLQTSFGGVFLLVPALIALDFDDVFRQTPAAGTGKQDAALFRQVLLLKCLGSASLPSAVADPGVSCAAGLEEPVSIARLTAILEGVRAEQARGHLRWLLRALRNRDRITDVRALEVVVRGEAADRTLMIRDVTTDEWLFASEAARNADGARASLGEGLSLVDEAAGPARALFLGKPGAEDVGTFTDFPGGILRRYIRHARPAAADLAHFTLCSGPGDLVWTLIARSTLRLFAARLRGFEWSGAAYLAEKLLALPALVRIDGRRVDVRLTSCPLDVVLRMAGLDGRSWRVPWLDDLEVAVHLPGA